MIKARISLPTMPMVALLLGAMVVAAAAPRPSSAAPRPSSAAPCPSSAAPCTASTSPSNLAGWRDASPQVAAGNAHLVIISGLSGEEKYREAFREWALSLITAAESRMGIPSERITYMAEDIETAPERVDGRSTAETIESSLRDLADRVAPHDRIAIVLIGHGSARGGESRINLPGPDLTAADFSRLLDLFAEQTIALVNTTSSSGDFVATLSGRNRAIITATRDGYQNNETVFAAYFIEAYAEDVADLDKDDRVSLLEAYDYATREVQRFYDGEGRMRTETALLDDNGDAEGSHEPDPAVGDGSLARGFFLASSSASGAVEPRVGEAALDDPELRALYEQKATLEQRIDALRRIKDTMDPEAYMTELEALLVDLALTERAIRELGGTFVEDTT